MRRSHGRTPRSLRRHYPHQVQGVVQYRTSQPFGSPALRNDDTIPPFQVNENGAHQFGIQNTHSRKRANGDAARVVGASAGAGVINKTRPSQVNIGHEGAAREALTVITLRRATSLQASSHPIRGSGPPRCLLLAVPLLLCCCPFHIGVKNGLPSALSRLPN
jgi:hypothetical protein